MMEQIILMRNGKKRNNANEIHAHMNKIFGWMKCSDIWCMLCIYNHTHILQTVIAKNIDETDKIKYTTRK